MNITALLAATVIGGSAIAGSALLGSGPIAPAFTWTEHADNITYSCSYVSDQRVWCDPTNYPELG